ncbi:hypothetical protein [Weizmannia acidilactici]|uniref:hypothetical protein n=1 Tax=Weizmannia acidilactici TaxID=2607726 RepID=UPI00124E2852|nr:hypothetical protein [Weizmannia acidilactici]GER73431.1 hypothetical protein BpPP18_14980 [Weizmannia acidilactici]
MFNLLRLDLQFHAADTGADGGSAPGDTGQGGDQQTQTQQTQQTPSAQPQQTQTPPAQPPQPEPPKVDTKEIRNKAQADLLKKLGFENVDALQEVLTKYKEIEDSQKTEFQKQAEKLQELETNFSSVSEENATLKAQISAMKAGVKADAVEDVVVLAKQLISDDVDMDAAIKQVLEKYPQFGQEAPAQPQETQQPKPQFTQGQHNPSPQQTELEKWLAAFKK